MFLRHLVGAYIDIRGKFFTEIGPGGTPTLEGLNAIGVAKYSDFGHIEGYTSETVQDRRLVSITNRKSYTTFDWYQNR